MTEQPLNAVRIPRLPLAVDDGSIRARLVPRGSEAPTPSASATDIRVVLELPEHDPALAPPRDEEILAAEREVQILEAELNRLRYARSQLSELGILPRLDNGDDKTPRPSPTDARLKLLDVRDELHRDLSDSIGRTSDALDRQRRHFMALRERAKLASSARNTAEHELRKTALIRFDASISECDLELDYFVPGPTWAPYYSVAIDDDIARLEISAMVVQRTGEDWTGVSPVLSTATPTLIHELPELQSLRIGRAQRPRVQKGFRPPPEGVGLLYADRDAQLGPPSSPHPPPVARPMAKLGSAAPAPQPAADEAADNEAAADDPAANDPAAKDALDLVAVAGGPPPRVEFGASGAMPVLPPASAPMPKGAAFGGAPRSRSRDVTSSRVAEPMMSHMAQPMMSRIAQPAKKRAAPPPPPESADVDLQSLAYGSLRMQSGEHPLRGHLIAMNRASLWLELMEEAGIRIEIDVVAAVSVAIERSDGVRLPPKYRVPDSIDGFDYAYRAQGDASIRSDGLPHSVSLTTTSAKALHHYIVAPRESSDVFRSVSLQSPLDAALPFGPCDVYTQGRYLLTTDIEPTSPRATLRFGLGVEQGIRVARNTWFSEHTTGLMGGGLSLEHRIEIEVRNNLDRDAQLEVRERIPYAPEGNTEIEVESSATPDWEKWDQEQSLRGGRRWRFDLASFAQKTLEARYTIKTSSRYELEGGNRREDA